eukprot:gene21794-8448_t
MKRSRQILFTDVLTGLERIQKILPKNFWVPAEAGTQKIFGSIFWILSNPVSTKAKGALYDMLRFFEDSPDHAMGRSQATNDQIIRLMGILALNNTQMQKGIWWDPNRYAKQHDGSHGIYGKHFTCGNKGFKPHKMYLMHISDTFANNPLRFRDDPYTMAK